MNRNVLLILISIFSFILIFTGKGHTNGKSPVKETLPSKIFFKDAISSETMTYLGLSRKKNFFLDDMRGTLFVIEVFNTYCTSCPRNVPILNDVFSAVKKSAQEGGTIKIFGIAIGNTDREVESYRRTNNVLFPVLTDYDFSVHSALGNPRVPYTIYVSKAAKGPVVLDTHQGVLDSAEAILKKLEFLR